MNVQEIAERYNLDPQALEGQIAYLTRKAQEHPEAFMMNPKLFIETGVRKYNEMMREFLSELAFGKSERAAQLRAKLAADVYYEIRSKNNA